MIIEDSGERQPYIGENVHYIGRAPHHAFHYALPCAAATITDVTDPAGQAGLGIVNLAVFANGVTQVANASYVRAVESVPHSWHRPSVACGYSGERDGVWAR